MGLLKIQRGETVKPILDPVRPTSRSHLLLDKSVCTFQRPVLLFMHGPAPLLPVIYSSSCSSASCISARPCIYLTRPSPKEHLAIWLRAAVSDRTFPPEIFGSCDGSPRCARLPPQEANAHGSTNLCPTTPRRQFVKDPITRV